MSLILIVIILVLLFGGGGFYGHRQGYYGNRGFGGLLGFLVVILIVVFLFRSVFEPVAVDAPGAGVTTGPAARP